MPLLAYHFLQRQLLVVCGMLCIWCYLELLVTLFAVDWCISIQKSLLGYDREHLLLHGIIDCDRSSIWHQCKLLSLIEHLNLFLFEFFILEHMTLTTATLLLRRLFIQTLRFDQWNLCSFIQIGLLAAQVIQIIDIYQQLLLRWIQVMKAVANFLLLKFLIYFCYVIQNDISIWMWCLLDLVGVLLLVVVQIIQLLNVLHLLLLNMATWAWATVVVRVGYIPFRLVRGNAIVSAHFARRLALDCLICGSLAAWWKRCSMLSICQILNSRLAGIILYGWMRPLSIICIIPRPQLFVVLLLLEVIVISQRLSIPSIGVNVDIDNSITSLYPWIRNHYLSWIQRIKLYLILCLKRRLSILEAGHFSLMLYLLELLRWIQLLLILLGLSGHNFRCVVEILRVLALSLALVCDVRWAEKMLGKWSSLVHLGLYFRRLLWANLLSIICLICRSDAFGTSISTILPLSAQSHISVSFQFPLWVKIKVKSLPYFIRGWRRAMDLSEHMVAKMWLWSNGCIDLVLSHVLTHIDHTKRHWSVHALLHHFLSILQKLEVLLLYELPLIALTPFLGATSLHHLRLTPALVALCFFEIKPQSSSQACCEVLSVVKTGCHCLLLYRVRFLIRSHILQHVRIVLIWHLFLDSKLMQVSSIFDLGFLSWWFACFEL